MRDEGHGGYVERVGDGEPPSKSDGSRSLLRAWIYRSSVVLGAVGAFFLALVAVLYVPSGVGCSGGSYMAVALIGLGLVGVAAIGAAVAVWPLARKRRNIAVVPAAFVFTGLAWFCAFLLFWHATGLNHCYT